MIVRLAIRALVSRRFRENASCPAFRLRGVRRDLPHISVHSRWGIVTFTTIEEFIGTSLRNSARFRTSRSAGLPN